MGLFDRWQRPTPPPTGGHEGSVLPALAPDAADRLLARDGMFGLHPELAPLLLATTAVLVLAGHCGCTATCWSRSPATRV